MKVKWEYSDSNGRIWTYYKTLTVESFEEAIATVNSQSERWDERSWPQRLSVELRYLKPQEGGMVPV